MKSEVDGISLIITTYNWKEALSAVLQSVKKQSVLPNEVIVADDGSREDTRMAIHEMAKDFPVPLIHSWQEDLGFRAAMSRNRAIAKSSSPYMVIVDGDIILHPKFIEDHFRCAEKNCFVIGSRTLLSKQLTERILLGENIEISFFSKGIKNRKNLINNSFLSTLFTRKTTALKRAISCNMGFWKDDIIKVNGFNEDFTGWGREDSELVVRLLNAGFVRKSLKFKANGLHLYHPENNRDRLSVNDGLLAETIANKKTRCENGISNHLSIAKI
mgnify:CR=1 FL=1